jgi:DNA polymerase I-like protein with 3'-5' exonuclease and polymerase domains
MPKTKRKHDAHIGGTQLPLIVPESAWTPPAELPDLRGLKSWAIDTEEYDKGIQSSKGPGWATGNGYVCGVSVAWPGGTLYVPLVHPETECFDKAQVARWLNDHRHLRWVMHNAPYDLGWLQADLGVKPPDAIDDTTAMAVMIDENRLSYSLDDLCKSYGLAGKDDALLREACAAYALAGKPAANIHALPARYVGPYAQEDAVATYALADAMRPLVASEGAGGAYQLECDLIPMCIEMRRRGIRVDLTYALEARKLLITRRDEIFADLSHRLGTTVTMTEIGSTEWLHRHHQAQGITAPYTAPTKRFASGQPSYTAGSTGWMHKHSHWLPQLIAQADKCNNAATKFIDAFILGYANKGRIHASINQFRSDEGGTRTHRFSYSDPALQQQPSRDEEFKNLIRGCYLPEEGELWAEEDYAQQEYRLIVDYAYKSGLTKAADARDRYCHDPETDFHSMVAAMTGLERKPAKDTNFAKAYGAGVPKFAAMIGQPVERAQEIYDQYDREMPFVSQLAEKCERIAQQRGFVRLMDGVRCHFDLWEPVRWDLPDDLKSVPYMRHDACQTWAADLARDRGIRVRIKRANTRRAMNTLIQGSAARQTKLAMRACWREGLVPMLQLHDALSFSVDTPGKAERARELMETAVALDVPMRADIKYGRTWGTASHATWDEAMAKSR